MMTQAQYIVLALKVGLAAGVVSVSAFIADYTWRAPWWRDPIGRTLVVMEILVVLLFIPSILSLFFSFNRLSSVIAAWIDAGLICLVTPVTIWRIVVWEKEFRRARETRARDQGQRGPSLWRMPAR